MPAVELSVPAYAVSGHEPLLCIAHRLPGRVRLIVQGASAKHALQLAGRFASHSDVDRVRWAEAARSLTVWFDPERPFEAILDELQTFDPTPAPITVVRARTGRTVTFVAILLDLVTGNFLSLFLNLLSLKS